MAERISDGQAIMAQIVQHNKNYFNDAITTQYCVGTAKNASHYTDNKFLENQYDREKLNFICDEVEETGEPYILVSYGTEEVIAVVTHGEDVRDEYRWFKFALTERDSGGARIRDTGECLKVQGDLFCDRFVYAAMMDSIDIAQEIEEDDFMLPIVPTCGIFVPVSVKSNRGITFTYCYDSETGSSHEFFTAPAGMVSLSMLRTAWLDWYKSEFENGGDGLPYKWTISNDWIVESHLSSLDMSKAEMNSGVTARQAENSINMLTVGLTGTSGLGWSLTPTPRDRPDLGWNH